MAQYLQYRDVCEVICLFLYIVEMTSCNAWLEYEVNKVARLQCNEKQILQITLMNKFIIIKKTSCLWVTE
jgi:hypothetical protein